MKRIFGGSWSALCKFVGWGERDINFLPHQYKKQDRPTKDVGYRIG